MSGLSENRTGMSEKRQKWFGAWIVCLAGLGLVAAILSLATVHSETASTLGVVVEKHIVASANGESYVIVIEANGARHAIGVTSDEYYNVRVGDSRIWEERIVGDTLTPIMGLVIGFGSVCAALFILLKIEVEPVVEKKSVQKKQRRDEEGRTSAVDVLILGGIALLFISLGTVLLGATDSKVHGKVVAFDCASGWARHPVVVLNTSHGLSSYFATQGICLELSLTNGQEIIATVRAKEIIGYVIP